MKVEEWGPEEIKRWSEQDAEWHKIALELMAKRPAQVVTAHQITTEQRKRMMVRGEIPVLSLVPKEE